MVIIEHHFFFLFVGSGREECAYSHYYTITIEMMGGVGVGERARERQKE